jgi:adenylate/nucleoside-diphosphate kinase
LPAEDVAYFEKVYKPSKFGYNSAVYQSNPFKTSEHSLIYRDRLFYFSNEEEKLKFSLEPFNYAKEDALPLDVNFTTKVFILGPPKSGKSTMAQRLQDQIGLVHLKVSEIIRAGLEEDSLLGDHLRRVLKNGGKVDDDTLVKLISKRVQ